MEQEKGRTIRTAIFFVKFINPLTGQLRQRFILRLRFFGCVTEIGQQGKVDVVTPVCQEADFQRFDQFLDV